ncbi:MAG: hypothetical protein F4155_02245 [Acidimicrobiales bacterium]|nr:hypothetical protein [Acidimicrobiales bacterium]MYH73597.1 hypothetical protein [Acidimicrobiales bacterium]
MRPRAASVLLALALAAAGVAMPSPLVAVAAASSDDTQGDDAEPAPGPCEEGWVAPTPQAVAVDAVPVVVASTADDYFVLYVDHPNPGKIGDPRANEENPQDIAVSVTRGQEGTTVLRDNLRALSPARYRVEKYQVDTPGDLDGDCVDDITELDGFGAYNPLNPALKISSKIGRTAIPSHQRFVETSSLHAPLWRHRSIEKALIKFVIVDWLTSSPSVYFMDHSQAGTFTHAQVIQELRRLGIDDISTRSTLLGAVIHYPDVLAPDGSLGVYVYHFQQKMPPIPYFGHMNQLLASALPFVENDLAFIPDKSNFELMYNSDSAGFEAKRVNILLYEDKRHIPAYLPLNQAEGYGLLRLMGAGDDAPRPHEIPIYESLPNDLPRVAGSITTVPQTPLSHVNLRAIQNGVPNAFLRDILEDDDLKALIGKHVYFSVAADDFVLREATKSEVDAHHLAARPTQAQTPERDLTVTGIASLADVSFGDWDAFGVKAANMAELSKLSLPAGTVPTGYAVPFYFYDEFMKNAGLADDTVFGKKKWPAEDKFTLPAGTKLSAVVETMLAHPRFQADYSIQEEMLDDLRDAIKDAQSPAWIITALETMHAAYPEGQSLRYRSSTNNEDLPSFNGAGLYSSKTQDPDETAADGIDKSIKAVWASLWNFRAFLEREYHRVSHDTTAMGVLVHPNFSDERVNGVAVSFDPVTFSPDAYYVNSQLGEDLVTNPEALSHPEQLLLDTDGKANVLARSNLAKPGQLLMSDAQMVQLRSNLQTVHDGFKTLYSVQDGDRFAIEIEFKITAEGTLAIKQARPWVFADPISPPTVVPEVSVAAGSGITEGTDASFTVSASPAPTAPLPVSVTVTQDGDFGVSVFSGTVRVPTSGSVTVTVGTSDDDVDESDGSVSVTVDSGDGYTVSGAQGSASVAVSDDDDPPAGCGSAAVLAAQARANHDALPNTASNRKERNDWWRAWIALSGTTGTYNTPLTAAEARVLETGDPRWEPYRAALECLEGTPPPVVVPEVSVTAGAGVTEGGDASFTVTASPTPSAPLAVDVTIAQAGDFGAATGSRTVTVGTGGSATLTVSTSDDEADEADGSVSVAVDAGGGYTVSSAHGTASVAVSDDDDPPPADLPEVSVADGSVVEGELGWLSLLEFRVTLSEVSAQDVTVRYVIRSGTAVGGLDYWGGAGQVTIWAGFRSATIGVNVKDDTRREPDETLTVELTDADGAVIADSAGAATGTIIDND